MSEIREKYIIKLRTGNFPFTAKKQLLDDTKGEAHYKHVEAEIAELERSDNLVRTYLILYKSYWIKVPESGAWTCVDPETKIFREYSKDTIADLFTTKARDILKLQNMKIANIGYMPFSSEEFYFDRKGIERFNTYVYPPWMNLKSNEKDIPLIYREFFLEHIFNGHEPSYEYFLDWTADSIRPALKFKCYLVLMAREGLGKGAVGSIFKALHGEYNYEKIEWDQANGTYNGLIAKKTLIFLDELLIKNQKDEDKLKPLINDTLIVNEKYVPQYSVDNWASYYIATNHDHALRVSPNSRRYSILNTGNKKLDDFSLERFKMSGPDYVRNVLLNPSSIAKLASYLLHRKLTHSMQEPFLTTKSMTAMNASIADWEACFLNEICKINAGKEMTLKEAKMALADIGDHKINLTAKQLKRLSEAFSGIFTIKKASKPDDNGARPIKIYINKLKDQTSHDVDELS